jgi:hypothetical protein
MYREFWWGNLLENVHFKDRGDWRIWDITVTDNEEERRTEMAQEWYWIFGFYHHSLSILLSLGLAVVRTNNNVHIFFSLHVGNKLFLTKLDVLNRKITVKFSHMQFFCNLFFFLKRYNFVFETWRLTLRTRNRKCLDKYHTRRILAWNNTHAISQKRQHLQVTITSNKTTNKLHEVHWARSRRNWQMKVDMWVVWQKLTRMDMSLAWTCKQWAAESSKAEEKQAAHLFPFPF